MLKNTCHSSQSMEDIFDLKQQFYQDSLQDHAVKDDLQENMKNILQSKDTVGVFGFSKKWFTDRHATKLKHLNPFQDSVKDGMLRDILRKQDSQSSVTDVFSNLIKTFFSESDSTNIAFLDEFIQNPVIIEVMLSVYQKTSLTSDLKQCIAYVLRNMKRPGTSRRKLAVNVFWPNNS